MTGAFPRDVSDVADGVADSVADGEVDEVSGGGGGRAGAGAGSGGAGGSAAREGSAREVAAREGSAREVPTREVPTRGELRKQLLTHRIAGAVATPREDNLRKYAMFAERDPYHLFGLEPERVWRLADVVKLMSERAGVSGDLKYRSGQDHIDVELTLDALDRFADRLGKAAERRERVLLATGHPSTLLAVHLALATALREAGCEVIEAGAGWSYQASAQLGAGRKRRSIAYFGGVGVMAEGGSLVHTHSARPIRAALASLAGDGEPLPDLVVADHGWCGGAGQAGIDAIGFADSNDPALFVGEAEGVVQVAVPLDDGIAPRHYEGLVGYLVGRAGL